MIVAVEFRRTLLFVFVASVAHWICNKGEIRTEHVLFKMCFVPTLPIRVRPLFPHKLCVFVPLFDSVLVDRRPSTCAPLHHASRYTPSRDTIKPFPPGPRGCRRGMPKWRGGCRAHQWGTGNQDRKGRFTLSSRVT